MDVSSLAKIHNCHLRFAFDVRVQTFRVYKCCSTTHAWNTMTFLVSVMPHARGERIHPDRMELKKVCNRLVYPKNIVE